MGYSTTGAEGNVVSWGASNFYATLLSRVSPFEASIQVENEDHDITGLNVEAVSMLPGLKSWTATLRARGFATPRMGNVGTVAYSAGGYVLHANKWTARIEAGQVHDITEFASSPASGPTWKSWRPDGVKVSGTISCFADSATALVNPHGIGDTLPTLTLIYGDEAIGDPDDSLAGVALIKQLSAAVRRGSRNEANYSFDGSAAWTPAGTTSIFGTAALGTPLWSQGGAAVGALVVATMTGTRTLSGEDSFYRSIELTVESGRPVELTVEVQGVGALTPA